VRRREEESRAEKRREESREERREEGRERESREGVERGREVRRGSNTGRLITIFMFNFSSFISFTFPLYRKYSISIFYYQFFILLN
jgi:hypothetical protein